ncbi:MAG: hypothetical protein IJU68_08085 [Bacteroidales bacterium]|nr:hypothetical protein [Bacteroidales bacterium]
MRLPIAILFTAVVLAVSCKEPSSRETFLRSNGTGEYAYDVEFPDSAARYNLSFFTAIDRPVMAPDTLVSFPLHIVWRSPSGLFFSETVYYPVKERRVLYRSDTVPGETGVWSLSVSLDPEPDGMRGLGLIVEKLD